MEQHVALRLGLGKRAAIDLDGVPRRVGVGARLDHGDAVDADPARDDQALGGAPGRDARVGQELVEPDGRHRP